MADQGEDQVELVDARAIRALAHPARLAVVNALYDRDEELTATQAAAIAGTSPSAMSYHLRALESFGIIKRSSRSSDGREHPWVRAARSLSIRPGGASSTAASTATKAVVALDAQHRLEELLGAMDRALRAEDDSLEGFIVYNHTAIRVTRDEAQTLFRSISELLEKWRVEVRHNAPADAEIVSTTVTAYLQPAARRHLAMD
jgi:DNA-binding transcriptional ArsR family regulator